MSKRFKTPTCLQLEQTECGAASLGSILGYYDCFVPLEELRSQCGVSRNGSKASHLMEAASHYGLEAHFCFYYREDLSQLEGPCIILWEHCHYVVFEGQGKHHVYINDPAYGERHVSYEEFDRCFSQATITFKPTDQLQKRRREHRALKHLGQLLSSELTTTLFIGVITLLLTLPNISIAVLTQIFIDHFLIQGQFDWLAPLLMIMLLLFVTQYCLLAVQHIILKRLETKLALSMNYHFISYMLTLPLRFFTQRQTGDLLTRFQSNDNIARQLSGPLGLAFITLIQAVIYLIIMLCYSWILGCIALLLSIINCGSFFLLKKQRSRLSILNTQKSAQLTATVAQGLSGIETIKASGGENSLFNHWHSQLNEYLNSSQSLTFLNTVTSALPAFLKTLGNAVILGVGAWLAINGSLSVGGIIAFQSLFLLFNAPIEQFVDVAGQIQQLEADFKRVNDVYYYQPMPQPKRDDNTSIFEQAQFQGQIEFKNVTFGYNPLEPPLIDDLSLTIKPGSKVAFVGHSGCGKSTLAKLVSGLYTPWSGQILIDGWDLNQLKSDERARLIAMVSQTFFFFQGSIRDNLTFWDRSITERTLAKPCQQACIDDVIQQHAKHFDYPLSESAHNLSGGQKQRLEIARTLLQQPMVLVLDEATSALDRLVESRVLTNIMQHDLTTISIAHRLNTIQHSDQIYVMSQGKLVEQGTHEELIQQEDSHYQALVQAEE